MIQNQLIKPRKFLSKEAAEYVQKLKKKLEPLDSKLIKFITSTVQLNYNIQCKEIFNNILQLYYQNQVYLQLLPLVLCKYISIELKKTQFSLKELQKKIELCLLNFTPLISAQTNHGTQQPIEKEKHIFKIQYNGKMSQHFKLNRINTFYHLIINVKRIHRQVKDSNPDTKDIMSMFNKIASMSHMHYLFSQKNQDISIIKIAAENLIQPRDKQAIDSKIEIQYQASQDKSLNSFTHILVKQIKSNIQEILFKKTSKKIVQIYNKNWVTLSFWFPSRKEVVGAIQKFEQLCKDKSYQIFEVYGDLYDAESQEISIGFKIKNINCTIRFILKHRHRLLSFKNYLKQLTKSPLGVLSQILLEKNKINQFQITTYIQQLIANLKKKQNKDKYPSLQMFLDEVDQKWIQNTSVIQAGEQLNSRREEIHKKSDYIMQSSKTMKEIDGKRSRLSLNLYPSESEFGQFNGQKMRFFSPKGQDKNFIDIKTIEKRNKNTLERIKQMQFNTFRYSPPKQNRSFTEFLQKIEQTVKKQVPTKNTSNNVQILNLINEYKLKLNTSGVESDSSMIEHAPKKATMSFDEELIQIFEMKDKQVQSQKIMQLEQEVSAFKKKQELLKKKEEQLLARISQIQSEKQRKLKQNQEKYESIIRKLQQSKEKYKASTQQLREKYHLLAQRHQQDYRQVQSIMENQQRVFQVNKKHAQLQRQLMIEIAKLQQEKLQLRKALEECLNSSLPNLKDKEQKIMIILKNDQTIQQEIQEIAQQNKRLASLQLKSNERVKQLQENVQLLKKDIESTSQEITFSHKEQKKSLKKKLLYTNLFFFILLFQAITFGLIFKILFK